MNNPDTTPEPHWTDVVGEILAAMACAAVVCIFIFIKLAPSAESIATLEQIVVQDTAVYTNSSE